jgi:hypothetical protein
MSSLAAFLRDYNQCSYSPLEIVEKYVQWVSQDEYMILFRSKRLHEDSLKGFTFENEYFAVKCAKRGNDVYRSRVYRRFKGLVGTSENLVFFNSEDRGVKRTRALWITLTYDIKLCSFDDAWRNVGVEFNRFMAYVRKRFGKVSCCRVFESFENGHPHIHCILFFETYFTVFRDSKGQFRVHTKDVISEGWHSNIDVKAMSSLVGGFSYLKKYLLKNNNADNADSKALMTLALCWVFRKRAFSVSGQFRKALTDLISSMHNSNRNSVQISLSGRTFPEEKFSVFGFVPIDVLDLAKDVRFAILNRQQISSVDEYLSEKIREDW